MTIGKSRRRNASAKRLSSAQALLLTPAVMFMRLPLMAGEVARTGLVGRETASAVTEKAAAVAEGIAAAQMSLFRSAMSFWPEVISGRTPSMFNGIAAERSMAAAIAPAGRRVRANYRRLGGS
jgi:hypothetical protein